MTGPPEPETPAVWPPSPVGFDAPAPVKPRRELLTGKKWLDFLLGFTILYWLSFFVQEIILSRAFVLFGVAFPLRPSKLVVAVVFLPIAILMSRATRACYPSFASGVLCGGIGQLTFALAELWRGRL